MGTLQDQVPNTLQRSPSRPRSTCLLRQAVVGRQVPFPGENISRLGKGEHWAWQALQGITRMPLPNQPVLRLARSIQMRSTENGPSHSLAYSLSELETLAGVPICVKSRTSFPHFQVREGSSFCTPIGVIELEDLVTTRSLGSDNVSLSSPCFKLRVSH